MKTQRILSVSVLGLALLTSAACTSAGDSSGSAIGDPGSGEVKPTEASNLNPGGGDPGSGEVKPDDPQPAVGGDPVSLEDAVNLHDGADRINHQVLEEDCGASQDCLDQLADFKAWIDGCADCPPAAAKFNDDVTSSQLRNDTIPTSYPQAADVLSWIATSADPNANAGDSKPDAVDVDLGAAADDLAKRIEDLPADEMVDWETIKQEMDDATRDVLADKLEDTFTDLADSDPVIKDLLDGEKVSAADAVDAIVKAGAALDD